MAVVPFEPGYEMLALLEMERWLSVRGCVDIEKFCIDSRANSNIKEFVVYYTQEIK